MATYWIVYIQGLQAVEYAEGNGGGSTGKWAEVLTSVL